MTGRILVTGAGGFIGGAVVACLAAAGHEVRAGIRGAPVAGAVRCDLDDPSTIEPALEGVEAVVHAAFGAVDRMPAQFAALLQAATRAGVARAVLFSSVAVYGEREGVVREGDGPQGRIDAYGTAKQNCEALLRTWVAADPARRAVVLRPGIVYGRGSRFWIDHMAARIRSGAWGTFGRRGDGVAALIHVDDVTLAVRLSLDAMRPGGPLDGGVTTLNLVGPDRPSWNGYVEMLARVLGTGPLRAIGGAELAARQAAATMLKLGARAGLPVPFGLAAAPLPAEIRLFSRRADYAIGAARTLLGWSPRVRLDEGLRRSFASPGPATIATAPLGSAEFQPKSGRFHLALRGMDKEA